MLYSKYGYEILRTARKTSFKSYFTSMTKHFVITMCKQGGATEIFSKTVTKN